MMGYTGYGAAPTREELAKRLQAQIMGQALPQTIGGGMGMLGAGLAANFAKQNAAFPTAPGAAKPSLMTGLANFFTGGRNGGLY
ncbi:MULTISPECIES: hypothetical protein [Sinorhizobium]|uniref:hypothetical protein n=1 Tax=Sinorhizobium TaxID=28105 RepID=UPI000301B4F0|nr:MULTISPECIES: hypothetical protein [Sinorhizobium]ASP92473.1 hypothetical protein CDO25_15770 [Sinorhizobium meliloti]ASP92763.1 hypothetical protein CDO25_17510 [Sinorhizobium meliloti]ATB03621.1 hypothetical protein BWO90_16500 [Sinorhizobium meliloti]MBO1959500.1 hypothetical protein [Sinorhizobium medicae]MDE3873008.1 hypothetical protein [Sinorhizobium meliloti]